MSTCYEQANEPVHEMAREVLEKYHPELRMPDKDYVRLCLLFAFAADDDDEPALKLHGYPARAVVSIIPLKQRVDKRADAEIIIDRENWDDLTEPQQRALLDHEIEHLEIQKDENGFVKTDDIGRPKLKMKLHDFDFGGFRSIARRHGENAPEVILAKKFEEDFGKDVLTTDSLPFRVNKETLEPHLKKAFGSKLVSVEDGPSGPTVTINADR